MSKKIKCSGIYMLIDPTTNETRYIGQSKDISRRYYQHLHNNSGNCTYLKNWMATLSSDPKLEILEICDLSTINAREKYWIKVYKDNGARLTNLTDGGDGMSGYIRSEESKQRISNSLMGHEVLPETREKLRLAAIEQHKTNPHIYTLEQKKALSEARKGMKFSEEHRKNIGLARKGRKVPNKKGLVIIDNFGNSFVSASKAATFHNMTISTVCRLVSGQIKTSSTGISFKKVA